MDESRRARYQRYPLIRLVEWFVLDTIGYLDAREHAAASHFVEQVAGPGDWRAVLRAQLRFDDGTEKRIADGWDRFRDDARRAGTTAQPREFAERIADDWADRELVKKRTS